MADEGAPIKTTEGVLAIAVFLKEMFPVVRAIQVLAVDVCDLRVGFLGSFHSSTLKTFDRQYVDLLGRFMRIYRTWSDVNELFKGFDGKDVRQAALMVNDYTNARGAVREHLDEGFRMLGHIDRVISDCKTTAYNRVTMFLAVAAIVVSVIAIMIA